MYRTLIGTALLTLLLQAPVRAIDPGRDFSGKWFLDSRGSNFRTLPFEPEHSLDVAQREDSVQCTSGGSHWSFALDGKESRYRIGKESRNSVVKWEGAALLINTLVSGPENYTIMDRWRLSQSGAVLTVTRQIVQATGQHDGVLVYRRDEPSAAAPAPARDVGEERPAIAPELARRADPGESAPHVQADILVRAGTRIPLVFLNDVDTKHSHEGDRIYLRTSFPIVVNNRMAIPRGSAVTGVVTQTKRPGRISGKGELFIRFDSLTLPNGVTRNLRSRLGAGDASAPGKVDPKEGKVTGEGNKAGDARKVGEAAGGGATVGVITGGVAGNAAKGAGVGGAAGAAAGLASVLLSRGPDAMLHRGTTVEMILDRDLLFRAEELP